MHRLVPSLDDNPCVIEPTKIHLRMSLLLLPVTQLLRQNTDIMMGAAIRSVCDLEARNVSQPYQNVGGGTTTYCPVTHACTVRKHYIYR